MRIILKSFLVILSIGLSAQYLCSPGYVMSGTGNVNNLVGVGLHPEQAAQIDANYATSIKEDLIPYSSTPTLNPDLGTATKPFKDLYTTGTHNYGVFVPTLAATPVEGTNSLRKGMVNVIPTNAANNVGLLAPVPVAGDRYEIVNNSGASQRIKAAGTPGVNGAAAGTYAISTTGSRLLCVATSATNYQCDMVAQVLTPAGP